MKLSKLYLSLMLVILIWLSLIAYYFYISLENPFVDNSWENRLGMFFGLSVFIMLPPFILYAECLYRRILPKVDEFVGEHIFHTSPVFDYDLSIKSFLVATITLGGMMRYSKLINYAVKICNPWIERRLNRKHKYYRIVEFDKMSKNLRIPLIVYFYWFVLIIFFMILTGFFL